MIEIRHSDSRGKADLGWLQSKHTFSFSSYYDPAHMGVSALRVINDDKVSPDKGFSTHSHQDMEIISYVKRGMIEHKDSMGNIEKLPAGEFQLMSAGTGVTHSEYNPSATESLEFLQIWVEPNVLGIEPCYQQKKFEMMQGMQLIASSDAREGSLLIHQDTSVYQLCLVPGEQLSYSLSGKRSLYIHMVSGNMHVNGELITEGDGATVRQINAVELKALDPIEALLFDLP